MTSISLYILGGMELIADIFGKVTTIVCLTVGLLSSIYSQVVWVGLWTIFAGLLLLVFEWNWSFCSGIKKVANDRYFVNNGSTKALYYLVLAVLCFFDKTICIFAGAMLVVTSFLNVTASLKADAFNDEVDELLTDDEIPTETSSKFGTF